METIKLNKIPLKKKNGQSTDKQTKTLQIITKGLKYKTFHSGSIIKMFKKHIFD